MSPWNLIIESLFLKPVLFQSVVSFLSSFSWNPGVVIIVFRFSYGVLDYLRMCENWREGCGEESITENKIEVVGGGKIVAHKVLSL